MIKIEKLIEITPEDVAAAVLDRPKLHCITTCPTHQALRRYIKSEIKFVVSYFGAFTADRLDIIANFEQKLVEEIEKNGYSHGCHRFTPGTYEIEVIKPEYLKDECKNQSI